VELKGGGAAHNFARSQKSTLAGRGVEHRRGLSAGPRNLAGCEIDTADRLVAAGRAELVRGWHLERTEMLALSLARLDAVFRGAVAWGFTMTPLPYSMPGQG
jgi:hypothetical protein